MHPDDEDPRVYLERVAARLSEEVFDAFFTVHARGNWWGDAGGPGTGAGDGVSDGVDFSAWRETPVALVASFGHDSLFIPPG